MPAVSRILVVVLCLFLVACGESRSPASPTPAPAPAPQPAPTVVNIGGAWGGRMEMTFNGRRDSVSTSAELRQTDRDVVGAWRVTSADNDIRGEISGSLTGLGVDTQFGGTVTWDSSAEGSQARCVGRGRFTGPVAPSMRLESSGFQLDTCTGGPTQIVWTLQAATAPAPSPASGSTCRFCP